ncbi:MAG: hypothetical protein HZB29_02985 [Nitrospinae bacterium]|nr:hypothetical protein [Nitrospinota bacterium]
MFLTLLLITLVIASGVSAIVSSAFSKPVEGILKRIIADDISAAWLKYLKFAILVAGISSGARIYDLEKYISPMRCGKDEQRIIELTADRWILETYRIIIETLQGIAWLLLVFFVFALIAYVIVRKAEMGESANEGNKIK